MASCFIPQCTPAVTPASPNFASKRRDPQTLPCSPRSGPPSVPSTPVAPAPDDSAFVEFTPSSVPDYKDWGTVLWSSSDPTDVGESAVHVGPVTPSLTLTPLYRSYPQSSQRRHQLRAAWKRAQRRRRPTPAASPPTPPHRPQPVPPLQDLPPPLLPTAGSIDEVFLWHDVETCLLSGGRLELASDGEGAAYFCKDQSGVPIAVFKPYDEEPGAAGNPRGGDPPMLGGIPPGAGWLREVAAYRLDHEGFARVPETTAVRLPAGLGPWGGDKYGSLQRFVAPAPGCQVLAAADVLPASFVTEDVHRIGVLDLRLGNCDRHGGNLLAQVPAGRARSGVRLVPIDHGYVLPYSYEHLDFEWLWYPQASEPFSAATLQYIAALDAESDAAVLSELGLAPPALDLLRGATRLLQAGAAAGLTLRDLAQLARRSTYNEGSACEEAMRRARVTDPPDWAAFDATLRDLCPALAAA